MSTFTGGVLMMADELAIGGFKIGMLSIGAVFELSVAEVVEEPLHASKALTISISIITAVKFFLLIMIIHLRLNF